MRLIINQKRLDQYFAAIVAENTIIIGKPSKSLVFYSKPFHND